MAIKKWATPPEMQIYLLSICPKLPKRIFNSNTLALLNIIFLDRIYKIFRI